MEKKSSMDVLEECRKYNQMIIYGEGTIANIFYCVKDVLLGNRGTSFD